jgi:hypothetical protein
MDAVLERPVTGRVDLPPGRKTFSGPKSDEEDLMPADAGDGFG